MSLQHAAKHLAAHGRGPDTVLVHMSKGEVKSLNDLAMAHGGHLTINPKTGLPEAGFLSSILPMALGFALGPAGFLGTSALTATQAGLVSGIAGMALNPKGGLMGGLMAGLGGYGGASLGQSLANAGMQEATNAEMAKAVAGGAHTPEAAAQAFGSNGFGNAALQNPALAGQQAAYSNLGAMDKLKTLGGTLGSESGRAAFMDQAGGLSGLAKTGAMAAAPLLADAMKEDAPPEVKTDSDPGQQYKYAANPTNPTPASDRYGREQTYFNPTYTNAAAGGMMASGGVSVGMSGQVSRDGDTEEPDIPMSYSYDPMAQRFSEIAAMPSIDQAGQGVAKQVQNLAPQRYSYNAGNQQYTEMATGGISDAYNLGGYSDGGRLLRGPGDGVSDSIPAVIGKKQPARLADGEFVVPARIVSEIGNGSTEAGARKLYAMMDRIQKARSKTVGKGKIAKNSRAEQYLPA